jgi:two-component system chemotaxis sensor kinase CheA
MDSIIQEFLMETAENLSQLDVDLVALEQDHNNTGLLGNIFRTIHTIKGTCGFIGLPRLEKVAHAGENILGKFRDGELEVTPQAITAILECVDTIKEIMKAIEENGEEPAGDDTKLLKTLAKIENDENAARALDSTPATVQEDSLDDQAAEESVFPQDQAALEEDDDHEADDHPQAPSPEQIEAGQKEAAKFNKADSVIHQNIRVNVSLLENLITSVSELVLARNQLLQIARTSENDEFKVPLQRLNHVTSELQEGLMRTRMQPVGNAWSKLPRIVRDLSQELGKDIELEMIGAETELDRQVIEIIKDPLMHMVRNSADHGLETPRERQQAGKPKKGIIKLCAYHAGGHVVMEISDNGRGLNKEKIKEKILSKGLLKPEDFNNVSDEQIYNYIFDAGFSTAAKVTNVSGRGVGMDVVKSNIEKIGGSVEVSSTPGQGSMFTVKIPLTLAIVSALIIRSKTQKFAIPQTSIVELVQASEDSEHKMEFINGHPVLRLRDKLLPLISLSNLLQLKDEMPADPQGTEDESPENAKSKANDNQFIIVAQVGSGQFGIIVDEVFDTEEIVIKPVSPILRQANIFAGNTILGDGSVVMILEPKGIRNRMGEVLTEHEMKAAKEKTFDSPTDRRTRFLIFKDHDQAPKAVPLALVVRLEEVNTSDIEISNGLHVLQYRNCLMPLTSMQGIIDYEEETTRPVLVFEQKGEYLGLMVEEIVDIVEENLEIKMGTSQSGTFGNMVIGGHTTDLIDVDYFIHQICPRWESLLLGSGEAAKKDQDITICFIDHCALYRNLVVPLLELQQIKSLVFNDGRVVQNYFEDHDVNIDAIIIDKASFGGTPEEFFATYQTHFKDKPCFVIGSHFSAKEEAFLQKAGCITTLLKNDRDAIIATVRDYIEQMRSVAA